MGNAQWGKFVRHKFLGQKKKRGTPPAKLRRLTRIFANFYKVIKIDKNRRFLTIFGHFRDPGKPFVRKMPKSEKRDIFGFEIGHKIAISEISRGSPQNPGKSPFLAFFRLFSAFLPIFRKFYEILLNRYKSL